MDINMIILLMIALAIVLGYKTNINTGLFAICFSFLIGCFGLGLGTSEVIKMWPIKIFFSILGVTLFYNIAVLNGTLRKLTIYFLYPFRNNPSLLPMVIFFVCVIISSFGAGAFAVIAFAAPITLMLCDLVGIDKILGAIALNCGAIGGANLVTSIQGLVFRELMNDVGYVDQSFVYTLFIFLIGLLHPAILLAVLSFVNREHIRRSEINALKCELFKKKEKQTLMLIVLMLTVILGIPIGHILMPSSGAIAYLNSKTDASLVAVVFAVIALLMGLADQRELIARLPWNTLLMISGVGMLVQVAVQAGTVDMLANWVSFSIPKALVPLILVLIGCCMSFFSSTIGAVCPALFPAVPSISAATGWNPMLLFMVIVIGAQSSAISPLSSNGSLILGTCTETEEQNDLFNRMIIQAVPICLTSALVACGIISLLF